MIEEKDYTLTGQDGVTRTYVLHPIPAIKGSEILVKIPSNAIPKVGEIDELFKARDDIMKFVSIRLDNGQLLRLETHTLIDNHVSGGAELLKICGASINHNFDFLGKLVRQNFLDSLSVKVRDFAMNFLKEFSAQSSAKTKRL